jgi:hypothetical protein
MNSKGNPIAQVTIPRAMRSATSKSAPMIVEEEEEEEN